MEAVWLNIQKWFNTRLKSLKADVNLAVNQRIKTAAKGGFTTDVKRSISSGERSQQRENTRASESGKAFLSSFFLSFFLALASFRVPLACDFSRYSDNVYPPTEDLVCRIQYQL